MAPKILVFTGAPLSGALDWDESNLIDTFCEPIARFTGLAQVEDGSFVPATAETFLGQSILEIYPFRTGASRHRSLAQFTPMARTIKELPSSLPRISTLSLKNYHSRTMAIVRLR